MLSEKIKDLFYDYYNFRWRNGGIAGTITAHTSTNGSGTFLIVTDKKPKKITKN